MAPPSKFVPRNVFVTVGSTSFDELIRTVIDSSTVDQLRRLGFKKLTIQSGTYEIDQESFSGLELYSYNYSGDLTVDIMAADLVIGHAGAGTCLEVLRHNKRLLVVTNDSLMDSHQDELAETLEENNYLIRSKLENFHENLAKICNKNTQLETFPPASDSRFEAIFNKALIEAKTS